MSTDDRRMRRAGGQRMIDRLAADHLALPEVNRAAMFGSSGLRVDKKFFAFVGADGGLVLKVPAARAAALVAAGEAIQVRVGRNPAREWINVPSSGAGEDNPLWPALLSEAYRHVRSASRSSTQATARADPDP